ncbi:MAG: hypothetical protein A2277_19970 [Desulfobacterales bacterium RIFOXYA12_FULL_46_15]|nr:MAG: hypothetical protein A2277_19970 [Desulfobacterales bacterium RIFOXYA12_FULL_46_15]
MDRKTALGILNLDVSASLADAKKAYRTLAKLYHPDVGGEISSTEEDPEARMKNINLAYRFIAPLLKLDESVTHDLKSISKEKHPEPRSKNTKKTGWADFLIKCEGFLIRLFFLKEEPVVLKKQSRKLSSKQEIKQKKDLFHDVLEKVYATPFDFEKRKTRIPKKRVLSKKHTDNDYQRYLELKQKMKPCRSGKNFNIPVGRVTKIKPVSRINPVNHD